MSIKEQEEASGGGEGGEGGLLADLHSEDRSCPYTIALYPCSA